MRCSSKCWRRLRTCGSVQGVVFRGKKRSSQHEESVSDSAERGVMVEAAPGAAFEVVQAYTGAPVSRARCPLAVSRARICSRAPRPAPCSACEDAHCGLPPSAVAEAELQAAILCECSARPSGSAALCPGRPLETPVHHRTPRPPAPRADALPSSTPRPTAPALSPTCVQTAPSWAPPLPHASWRRAPSPRADTAASPCTHCPCLQPGAGSPPPGSYPCGPRCRRALARSGGMRRRMPLHWTSLIRRPPRWKGRRPHVGGCLLSSFSNRSAHQRVPISLGG